MKRKTIAALLVILLAGSVAVAAGTLVVTRRGNPGAERISLRWTSEAGVVSQTVGGIEGLPQRVVYVVDTATTTTLPTTGYDVQLLDDYSVDVLSMTGSDLAVTADETSKLFFPATSTTQTTGTQIFNTGPLTLSIANSGTSPTITTGEIVLYVSD